MKVAVICFAGTNCETDTKYAFELLGTKVDIIWHKETKLEKSYDLIVLPGGFSYGDYLRSGAIANFSPIISCILSYAKKGGRILGICNGFQILLEARLLAGAMRKNANLRFISKFVNIKIASNKFFKNLKKDESLYMPVAHSEGNYYIDEDGLKSLYDNEQVLFKYCDENKNSINLNGSIDNIAGISNKDKNIFALMPHPERAVDMGYQDGLKLLMDFLA